MDLEIQKAIGNSDNCKYTVEDITLDHGDTLLEALKRIRVINHEWFLEYLVKN